jgi:hypothetical protein
MTDDRFERDLRTWFEHQAGNLRVPESLEEDVAAIATARGAAPARDRVVRRLDPTLQIRFPWRGTRNVAVASAGKLLVAAGLVVVAIAGAALLRNSDQVAPAGVGASPSASLRVSPGPSPDPLETERPYRTIDGILFSFDMPGDWESPGSWDGHGSDFPNYISRSVVGGQAAEGQVFWSGYPVTGPYAMACAYLRNLDPDATVAAFTEAVATVPGTDVISRTDLSVGGRPATKVVFIVRDDVGCDPGFFFTYANTNWGALWPETRPGDTVRVWIVDAGRRPTIGWQLLVIEGKTRSDDSTLEEEINAIVESIRFD